MCIYLGRWLWTQHLLAAEDNVWRWRPGGSGWVSVYFQPWLVEILRLKIGMFQNGLFKTDFEAHDNFSSFFSKFLQTLCACPITFITLSQVGMSPGREGKWSIELDMRGAMNLLVIPGNKRTKEPLAASMTGVEFFLVNVLNDHCLIWTALLCQPPSIPLRQVQLTCG